MLTPPKTVKPIALMSWLVNLVCPPGGTVYDPFTGSGSTGCAAVLNGFRFVGSELDPEYIEIARRRIAHFEKYGDRWDDAATGGIDRSRVYQMAEDRKVQVCTSCNRRNPSGVTLCQSCGGLLEWRDEQAERVERIPRLSDLPLFASMVAD